LIPGPILVPADIAGSGATGSLGLGFHILQAGAGVLLNRGRLECFQRSVQYVLAGGGKRITGLETLEEVLGKCI
jgi:hypothetical protein